MNNFVHHLNQYKSRLPYFIEPCLLKKSVETFFLNVHILISVKKGNSLVSIEGYAKCQCTLYEKKGGLDLKAGKENNIKGILCSYILKPQGQQKYLAPL